MQRDLCAYPWDVKNAAEKLASFTAGLSFQDYTTRPLEQAAVERMFEIIGEALRQARESFPGALDCIPDLAVAISQRNRIAHAYFAIDQRVLWDTIQSDIPRLRRAITTLMDERCSGVARSSI